MAICVGAYKRMKTVVFTENDPRFLTEAFDYTVSKQQDGMKHGNLALLREGIPWVCSIFSSGRGPRDG